MVPLPFQPQGAVQLSTGVRNIGYEDAGGGRGRLRLAPVEARLGAAEDTLAEAAVELAAVLCARVHVDDARHLGAKARTELRTAQQKGMTLNDKRTFVGVAPNTHSAIVFTRNVCCMTLLYDIWGREGT